MTKVDAKCPRDVIKEAFRYELIVDGEVWLDMLEKRNRLAHTYNENNFMEALNSNEHQPIPYMIDLVD